MSELTWLTVYIFVFFSICRAQPEKGLLFLFTTVDYKSKAFIHQFPIRAKSAQGVCQYGRRILRDRGNGFFQHRLVDISTAFDRLNVKLLSEVIHGFLQFWLFSELCKIGVIRIFLGKNAFLISTIRFISPYQT